MCDVGIRQTFLTKKPKLIFPTPVFALLPSHYGPQIGHSLLHTWILSPLTLPFLLMPEDQNVVLVRCWPWVFSRTEWTVYNLSRWATEGNCIDDCYSKRILKHCFPHPTLSLFHLPTCCWFRHIIRDRLETEETYIKEIKDIIDVSRFGARGMLIMYSNCKNFVAERNSG